MSLFALVLFISASILFVAGDSQHDDTHVLQQVMQVNPHTTHQIDALIVINELLTSNEFDASLADILPNIVQLPCCTAGCPIGACTTASLIGSPSQPNATQLAVPVFADKVTLAPTEPALIIEATQTWLCGTCPSTSEWCPCSNWSHPPTKTSRESMSATPNIPVTCGICTEGEICPCTKGITTTLSDLSQPTKAAEFPPELVGCARCSKGSEWCACSNPVPPIPTPTSTSTSTSELEPSSLSIPTTTADSASHPTEATDSGSGGCGACSAEWCSCSDGTPTWSATLDLASQSTEAVASNRGGCAGCPEDSEWCSCSNGRITWRSGHGPPTSYASKATHPASATPSPCPAHPTATGNPNLIPVIALSNSSTPTTLWAHIDLFAPTNAVSESVARALQHVKIGTHEISLSLVAGSQLSKFSDVTFTVVEDYYGAQLVLGMDFVREAFALTLHEAYLGEAAEGVPVLFGRG